MVPTHIPEKSLQAPQNLGLETRGEFRKAAVGLLEQMPDGDGQLVIDLTNTTHVDSAGLGALMLIQRRATERHLQVVLRGTRQELRLLLVLTKLDDLFTFETAGV
jgi:anti-sigma B factor antagonist